MTATATMLTPRFSIVFDAVAHAYTVGGQRLPGITSRLKACGIIDDSRFTEESRIRGSFVHEATQYSDEPGGLNADSVDPRIAGYLLAWEKAKSELNLQFDYPPEWPVAAPSLSYATVIDRIATTNGGAAGTTIINIKTGPPQKWHSLQLAGELIAFCETTGERETRCARASIHLRADGTYQYRHHGDRRELDIFRAVATVANWKEGAP